MTESCYSHSLPWLRSTPQYTTFRVNTLKTTSGDFQKILLEHLQQVIKERLEYGVKMEVPQVFLHDQISELVVVSGGQSCDDKSNLSTSEVVVDAACGAAVLRGAHVFAPGILGLSKGTSEGDKVTIYASLGTKCKRGWTQKLPTEDKLFVGNGILLMGRKKIFGANNPRGIAVRVVDNASGCPPLSIDFTRLGLALMQNLPSVVCSRVLNPQACDTVLDMCAAPGNKTSHLSSLMNNNGIIVALDRSAERIAKLQRLCHDFNIHNVHSFICDSVNAVKDSNSKEVIDICNIDYSKGPPFPPDAFDCILLDAPCSGSGQRPQLNPINIKHCASFPPLQRNLMQTAVKLLKPGGRLVYSTCSIFMDENEGIVRWALDSFPNLKLIPATPFLSPIHEYPVTSRLTKDEWSCLQKFASNLSFSHSVSCEEDTIGFFIAQFIKS